jgi:diguanylate cyclase (GGDEF)-like protein/PAS domain S-box-containing protein
MPRSKPDESSDVYRTLLESTKAIPWKIDWDTKTFAYIGPQIEALLGWTPASWATVQDWADRMHADDRKWVVDYCVSQSLSGLDHEADYRALTASGGYVWLRDVVHVIRKPDGTVDALVGFMFDISERKENEQRISALQRELEALSFKDGLTGVANRRRFDDSLQSIWASAISEHKPLSVVMIDIDFFKQYNDRYGHIDGDECLKRVSAALATAATRPGDFMARFGGEEFAIVLANTDEAGALVVAEHCREAVANAGIPHEMSKVARSVTVSVGVGSVVPKQGDDAIAFITSVDRRLYRAKQAGRNCIVHQG